MAPFGEGQNRASTAIAALAILASAGVLVYLAASGGGSADSSGPSPAIATASDVPGCSVVASGLGDAQSAVSDASPGSTVCLADGSYGKLSLDESKDAPGVTIRAEHPGKAKIAGADLSGSHLSLARFDVTDEITIEPGSEAIAVESNRITGGYFGVNAGPTTDTYIADTVIRGNQFTGPFGEDAIRLNRYHDGPDKDPYGILVEGNEFTGVRENGNHSDCLQSVWGGDGLYFTHNYLHDNRCQGFFIKDQPAPIRNIVVDDNLMLRNAAPCDPPNSGCGPPLIVHILGPTDGIQLSHNTVWTSTNLSPVAIREGPFGKISITDNAIFRGWSDWKGSWPDYTEKDNTVCRWETTMPPLSSSSTVDCSPPFRNPARDDYRLPGGVGVDWSPQDQHYGP